MYSGKIEELIRRLKLAQIPQSKVEICKPSQDIRYHKENIVSHNENVAPFTPIDNSLTMLQVGDWVGVVGAYKAQFFDDQLTQVCDPLALRRTGIIVAGFDMDCAGNPFVQ